MDALNMSPCKRPALLEVVVVIALVCCQPSFSQAALNPILEADFEGGGTATEAAGWELGANTGIETGAAGRGKHFVRCGCGDPVKPSAVRLPRIRVKPYTGYVARYLMRSDGPAHHTFGFLNPNGTFFVCRDAYASSAGKWGESVLRFRTVEQTELTLYLGRRYGKGAILYDEVNLVEDNSVQVGDLSPAPHPLPEVTEAESGHGYLVSTQHWMELIYPTYHPTRAEVATELRCRLTPGEYEPLTVSVTALRSLRNLRLTLDGDLRGPAGASLPASAVQVGVVCTLTRWLNNSAPLKAGQSYERRPLFIFPNAPVSVPARDTQRFWLTFHAPADLTPGTFRTSVRVSAEGMEATSLPLVVDVLPFRLPEPEATFGMYYRHCCQYPELRTEEFFRRSMADMRAHGCNSVSVYANIERQQTDGTHQIDFDLTGHGHGIGEAHYSLNRQMELLGSCGLLQDGHPLLFLACGIGNGRFANRERLVAAAEALRLSKGWPELLFYLVDEPAPEQRGLVHELADVVHRVPGVRSTTAIGNPGELGAFYDVWIISDSADPMEDIVAQARAMGKEAWTYNCQRNGCQPLNDRYFAGFFTWTARLRGNWQWCYTESNSGRVNAEGEVESTVPYYEDPWRNSYVLPGPHGNIPTLGWEARREGIDDYRYLQALRDAIRSVDRSTDGDRRDLARKAQRFLADIEQRTRRPKQNLPHMQTLRVYEHIIHPGLRPADYDAIRVQAADFVMRLQAQ